MSTAQEFLKKYGESFVIASEGTTIFPSVAIGQAALETGWGKSTIGSAHNMFGIKANTKWTGKVISMGTNEEYGGQSSHYAGTGKVYNSRQEAVNAGANTQTLFRYYDTFSDSIKDYFQFLQVNGRYAAALQAKTPEDQIREIHKAGYATASGYADSVIKIINQYGLKKYDSKKKIMKHIEIIGAVVSVLFGGYILYKQLM